MDRFKRSGKKSKAAKSTAASSASAAVDNQQKLKGKDETDFIRSSGNDVTDAALTTVKYERTQNGGLDDCDAVSVSKISSGGSNRSENSQVRSNWIVGSAESLSSGPALEELRSLRLEAEQRKKVNHQKDLTVAELTQRNTEMSKMFESLKSGDLDALSAGGESTMLHPIVKLIAKERVELVAAKVAMQRHLLRMKELERRVQSGDDCTLCVMHAIKQREADDNLPQKLTVATECTENPNVLEDQTRQVLLNDGREFHILTTSAREDSGVPVSCDENFLTSRNTNETNTKVGPAAGRTSVVTPASDDRRDSSVLLRATGNEASAVAASSDFSGKCPICGRADYTTLLAFEMHVNSHFEDTTDE